MNKFSYGNQVCRYFDKLYIKREYSQFKRYDRLIRLFKKQFNSSYCHLASASGRVEVVGNHTDHNGGKVIGCAVNLDIAAAFKPNDSNTVRIVSEGYSVIKYDVTKSPELRGAVGLAEGVTSYLKQAGYAVGGFDMFTHSTVPGGAGVSSSAALEMLIAVIVSHSFNNGIIPQDVMVRAGQYAENVYLNKPCGLLDQGASVAGGMVKFDFKNGFEYEQLAVNGADIKFALVDTGKSHAGLSALYASIPNEMRAVAELFGKQRLADVAANEVFSAEQTVRKKLGERPFLRAKHYFEENIRVEDMSLALRNGNADAVIKLINESGDSSMHQLQNCAVDENDTAIADAVAFARSLGNVGARVHGGGFAGTILCVMRSADFPFVCRALIERYGKSRVLPMTIRPSGAAVL